MILNFDDGKDWNSNNNIDILTGYFENKEGYNQLMNFINSLNIDENRLSLSNLKKKEETILVPDEVSKSINFIHNFIKKGLNEDEKWLWNNETLEVGDIGIMSRMSLIITHDENINNEKIKKFFTNIINLIKKAPDDALIFHEYNQFTSGEKYHNIYTTGIVNIFNLNKIEFKLDQTSLNFLLFILLNAPPLQFYIPPNGHGEENWRKDNLHLKHLYRGLKFYKILNDILIENEQPQAKNSLVKTILNMHIPESIDKFKITNESNNEVLGNYNFISKCSLAKFPDGGDGYPDNTTRVQLEILEENLDVVFDRFVSHVLLDTRHLITLLFGTQYNENYKKTYRNRLINKLNKILEGNNIPAKLQIFTRLKFILFEPIKISGENCYDLAVSSTKSFKQPNCRGLSGGYMKFLNNFLNKKSKKNRKRKSKRKFRKTRKNRKSRKSNKYRKTRKNRKSRKSK